MRIFSGASTVKISSGNYTGDGTQNRAIPHTLGQIPKLVIIHRVSAGNINSECWIIHYQDTDSIANMLAATNGAVTAMTNTNFYVGNAVQFYGNGNGITYYWTAFA